MDLMLRILLGITIAIILHELTHLLVISLNSNYAYFFIRYIYNKKEVVIV